MNIFNTIVAGSTDLNGFGATTLFLTPSAIPVFSGLITKIEYAWGDSETTEVRRKLDTSNLGDTSAYPIQSDLGDPRNVVVSHTFYPKESTIATFVVQVKIHFSNAYAVNFWSTYNLSVDRVQLVDTGTNNGYAIGFHLLANRNWGLNNNKMFLVETVRPNTVCALVAPQ